MEQNHIKLEQYRIYANQKDAFIDRTFQTNKFYIVVITLLAISVFFTQDIMLKFIPLNLLISLVAMSISILWWTNMDSYDFLIKIKLSNVIEEIEKELPIQPYAMEYAAIENYRKTQNKFLFSDISKTFATLYLLFFFVVFLVELIPFIARQFI